MTPNATSITPDQSERPVVWAGRWDALALSSRRNSPKRLTAKPTAIKPSPVRIQARKVLSAAKYTLGSCSAGLSMEGIVSAGWGQRNSVLRVLLHSRPATYRRVHEVVRHRKVLGPSCRC